MVIEMKQLDIILLNTSIIITPVLIYLLYSAYIKVQDKKEEGLIFTVTIILQIYLIYKYSIPLNPKMPLFIVDIPLLLSFYKKNNYLITVAALINIFYFSSYYEKYYLIIIAEYIIYIIISIREKNIKKFIMIFWAIKYIFVTYYKYPNMETLIELLFIFLISVFTIYLLNKAEEILNLHMQFKQITKEKQIHTSLFKITHEIKNPIAVCKGYLDMYDEKNIEKTKKYIPIIKEEIDRVLILLEDFLAMNRQKINKELLDINLLLEEVIKNMSILFKNNNIKVETIIPDEETYINADYNRLTQVFINLLKNSIEALENKKNPHIKLWIEEDKANIKVHIKDNGIGMSKEELEKITEPFYTTKLKGTGLGVSLSNEIIKAHKGKIKYSSKQNEYTEVTVLLPLEKAI